nr:FGGY-family carbohydrate kinase [Candidatus Sigynarchaeota archaeon]
QERQPDVYKIFDKIVERVDPGSNGVIFTPWLYGERAPVADETTRGGLFNLSMDISREHIIRAIFEGIAYNVRWLQIYVEKFIKRKLDNVRIIGGGANSAVWCQIFADIMGCNILQVKSPIQTNARGAALIASLGLGYIKEHDIPGCIEVATMFKPNPANKQTYDKLFKEYMNIYKAMKGIYKRLNSHSH